MLVKYMQPDSSFPALRRVKPHITDQEHRLRRLQEPPALPSHCKPWIDANSFGILMLFPYEASLIVRGRLGKSPLVRVRWTSGRPRHPQIVSLFSRTHFGLATQYSIRTEAGIGLFISPPTGQAHGRGIVQGLVETWWYPKPLFLVFQVPEPGASVEFRYGEPLCTLLQFFVRPSGLER